MQGRGQFRRGAREERLHRGRSGHERQIPEAHARNVRKASAQRLGPASDGIAFGLAQVRQVLGEQSLHAFPRRVIVAPPECRDDRPDQPLGRLAPQIGQRVVHDGSRVGKLHQHPSAVFGRGIGDLRHAQARDVGRGRILRGHVRWHAHVHDQWREARPGSGGQSLEVGTAHHRIRAAGGRDDGLDRVRGRAERVELAVHAAEFLGQRRGPFDRAVDDHHRNPVVAERPAASLGHRRHADQRHRTRRLLETLLDVTDDDVRQRHLADPAFRRGAEALGDAGRFVEHRPELAPDQAGRSRVFDRLLQLLRDFTLADPGRVEARGHHEDVLYGTFAVPEPEDLLGLARVRFVAAQRCEDPAAVDGQRGPVIRDERHLDPVARRQIDDLRRADLGRESRDPGFAGLPGNRQIPEQVRVAMPP